MSDAASSKPKPITQMSQPSDDEAEDNNEEEANAEETKLRHPNIDDECFSYTLRYHPEFPPLKHSTFYTGAENLH